MRRRFKDSYCPEECIEDEEDIRIEDYEITDTGMVTLHYDDLEEGHADYDSDVHAYDYYTEYVDYDYDVEARDVGNALYEIFLDLGDPKYDELADTPASDNKYHNALEEYANTHWSELLDKYYNEVLDYFRESAQEEFNGPDYDW